MNCFPAIILNLYLAESCSQEALAPWGNTLATHHLLLIYSPAFFFFNFNITNWFVMICCAIKNRLWKSTAHCIIMAKVLSITQHKSVYWWSDLPCINFCWNSTRNNLQYFKTKQDKLNKKKHCLLLENSVFITFCKMHSLVTA